MDSVEAQLRAYVRARVKPGEPLYKRGTAAALARHFAAWGLSEDAAWITTYVDPDANPRRDADIDAALAICDFFGITLTDFRSARPPQPTPMTHAQVEAAEAAALFEQLSPEQRQAYLTMLRPLVAAKRRRG